MSSTRKTALVTGVLFLITFATAIPALYLFQPVLDDPAGYIAGAGADNRILLGAFLELLLIIANIGTAVVLYPILKRQSETLALGYVTARLVECTLIAIGLVSVLAVVSLRQDAAGADAGSLGVALAAVKDWTFLLGPGFVVGVGNGLLLGYLMYRSGLVPRGHGRARAHRRSSDLPFGDRRAVRRIPVRRHGAKHRDNPGVPMGAVAWHLPHRQGIQAVSDPRFI